MLFESEQRSQFSDKRVAGNVVMDILSIAWLRSTKTETKEAWSAKGHSYIWIYQLNIIKYLQRCDNRHEYGFTVNAF